MRCVGIDNRQCRVDFVASAQVVAPVQHDKYEKEVVLEEDPDKKAGERDAK